MLIREDVSVRRWAWSSYTTRLSRVTSGGRFLPCVDGLRCFAILAVVLYHLNGYAVAKAVGFSELDARQTTLFHWLHGGHCGVQIFFAISGFILALPFARESYEGSQRICLRHFYLRRLTRLEPPFLLNILLMFLLLVVVSKQSWTELLAPLLATITYTHNWIYGQLSSVNGVAWSLEVEVQFYLLAPFLARAYFSHSSTQRRITIALMILAWIAVKMWLPVDGPWRLRLGLLYMLDHFLVGIAVADWYLCHCQESPVKRSRWDGIAVLAVVAIFGIQAQPSAHHLLPILTGLLFMAAFCGPLCNALLSRSLVVFVGGMCYTIYLYHFLVISLVGRFTMPFMEGHGYLAQVGAQAVLILPPTLLICAVLFVAIERPFMAWRPFSPSAG